MAEGSEIKTILTIAAVGVGGYFLYEWAVGAGYIPSLFGSTSTPPSTPPPPGTTGGGQPTTTTPAIPMTSVAANMQSILGMSNATADQWDSAFAQIMGQAIDAKYGFNFDAVYGPVVDGVRNNGAQTSALLFLQTAASQVPGGLPGLSGIGGLSSAIVHYPGPAWQTTGNLVYRAHHPLPYNLTSYRFPRGGMGALTRATGLEKVLWAQGRLRR
jgi:hypothetical protein